MILPPRAAVRLTTSASVSAAWAKRFVDAVAVGAFEDQVVDGIEGLRVADDGEAGAADVAGKAQAHAVGFDDHRAGTEHVAGVVGFVEESRGDFFAFA